MSIFVIKLIALATMIVDHTGAILFPELPVLRMIGRIAFPLYAFAMAQGCAHTHSGGRLLSRLFVFALITEPVFDLAFYGGAWNGLNMYWGHQNVLFTLLLGSLAVLTMRALEASGTHRSLLILAALPYAALAELLRTDYGAAGVMAVALFYLAALTGARLAPAAVCLALVCWLYAGAWPFLACASAAVAAVALYNGRAGPRMRWLFYASYPAHLLVLYAIKLFYVPT